MKILVLYWFGQIFDNLLLVGQICPSLAIYLRCVKGLVLKSQQQHAMDVLLVILYSQVEELQMYVEARMLQTLGKTNMVDFFIVGDTYKAKRIREAAKKFLRSNMVWLREQGDWKEAFGEKNMGLMVEVLMDLA